MRDIRLINQGFKIKEVIYMNKLIAIIPIYIEGKGDCTKVISTNNKVEIIEKSIESVIGSLMKKRVISYGELCKRTKDITGMGKNFPLYMTGVELMVPMKVRKCKLPRDRVYGFINVDYIMSVYKKVVKTKSNGDYHLLENESTFNRRLEMAEFVRQKFDNDETLGKIYGNNKLINEIIEIKEELTKLMGKIR